MLPAPMLSATDARRDDVTTAPDEAIDLAEVLAAEDARWAEMHGLIGRLTPEQVVQPGYYREGWTAQDLLAHVGTWLAEAGMMLERIAAGTYHHGELDVDAVNERTLDAMHDIAFPVVTAQASAARARMGTRWWSSANRRRKRRGGSARRGRIITTSISRGYGSGFEGWARARRRRSGARVARTRCR